MVDALNKVNINHLKLIFPFLQYHDILNLLCSSHIIYDSLIYETRQITISSKGLLRLLQDQSFFLNKIVDPSKQLSILFENEYDEVLEFLTGRESLLQSDQSLFPYSFLTPEINFPPLLKLSCDTTFFVYLCKVYPSFTVRKLEIQAKSEGLDEAMTASLSPHLIRVLEDLVLPSWEGLTTFPQLSLSLRSLSMRESTLHSPNLKYLHLESCENTRLDLKPYHLDTLELIHPAILDFDKINACKRLMVYYPEEIKNIRKAKQFQQIEFRDINIKTFPKESRSSVKDLILDYSEPWNPAFINLSSFTHLELFELCGCGLVEQDALLTLQAKKIAPCSLRIVDIYDFAGTVNLSCFCNVREISLDCCKQVTSLLGLEKVPRVILRSLPLVSLEGLGENDYVEISECASIKDFSALKYIKEVKIEECRGFVNAADVAYVQKLGIIGCEELEDLSGLMEVKDLYLKDCHNIVYCESFNKIPKLTIKHCKKLSTSHSINSRDFGLRHLGAKDGLSRLPDSLQLEILKFLRYRPMRWTISCNTHLYQRYNKTSFKIEDADFSMKNEKIDSMTLSQIPSTVKDIYFDDCSFTCSPNFPRGLTKLMFDNCIGMKNITDFCDAEKVIIRPINDDTVNLASLNRIKRLILDSCDKVIDYSPLQDNEEITFIHRSEMSFHFSQAFSNTKKINFVLDFLTNVEINLSFYPNLEVLDVLRGNVHCNGPCPPKLRKLYFKGVKKLSLPTGLDRLHLLHIDGCRNLISLKGLGSIPNIKLNGLPDLKSLEGLGPGNQFVQLVHLDGVEDFSAVSGCRKVMISGCRKFKDASMFAEANFLVIQRCDNLVDVSMLGKVKHLELIFCDNIWSLKGLERVKELIVFGCKLLEDQNNTRHRAWLAIDLDLY